MSQQKISRIYPLGHCNIPTIVPNKSDANQQQYREQCKDDINRLRDAIDQFKENENKTILQQEANNKSNKISPLSTLHFVAVKHFKGHNGKIYDSDWSTDCRLLLSGSQDGHLMVWDPRTSLKKVTYQLPSSGWVMACAFSPQTKYIASGGLDNICSIYKYHDTNEPKENKRTSSARFGGRKSKKHAKTNSAGLSNGYKSVIKDPPYKTLHHHEGYLSSVKFVSDEKIITASGDQTCILWDVVKKVPESVFLDHAGDVTTVAINGEDKQIFISGSVDGTIKLWDIRLSKCVGEFTTDADVNSVCWYPDNMAFAAGSDDATLRMFDIRAYKQMNEYFSDDIDATVTSVSFSSSGRILFAGYDDEPFGVGWDVAHAKPICELEHHQSVSSLKVAPNGAAILTGGWDKILRLWIGKT